MKKEEGCQHALKSISERSTVVGEVMQRNTSLFCVHSLVELIESTGHATAVVVVDMVAETLPNNMIALQRAITANDASAAAQVVHSMKSGIASIGGTHLWEMANILETKLKSSTIEDCTSEIDQFRNECVAFETTALQAIKEYLKTPVRH